MIKRFFDFLHRINPVAQVFEAVDELEMVYEGPKVDPVPVMICPNCYSDIYADHANDHRCPYCGGWLHLNAKIKEEINVDEF